MTLEDLHRKWFSGPCLNPAEQEAMWNGVPYVDKARQGVASLIDEKAVSLRRFGGPLILLLIGALLSLGILVVEVMWVKRYGEVRLRPSQWFWGCKVTRALISGAEGKKGIQ